MPPRSSAVVLGGLVISKYQATTFWPLDSRCNINNMSLWNIGFTRTEFWLAWTIKPLGAFLTAGRLKPPEMWRCGSGGCLEWPGAVRNAFKHWGSGQVPEVSDALHGSGHKRRSGSIASWGGSRGSRGRSGLSWRWMLQNRKQVPGSRFLASGAFNRELGLGLPRWPWCFEGLLDLQVNCEPRYEFNLLLGIQPKLTELSC